MVEAEAVEAEAEAMEVEAEAEAVGNTVVSIPCDVLVIKGGESSSQFRLFTIAKIEL